MNVLRKIWKLRAELIWICLVSVIPVFWFAPGQQILGHDSGFRLNFVQHLKNLTFAWNPFTNFGIDWSLYFGFIPIQLPETVFSFLTGSLRMGQQLTFAGYFALTGLSMYIFTRYFFPSDKYLPLRIVAPFFYTVNYYLIDAWTIAERAKFSLYIALPVCIVVMYKTVHREFSIVSGALITAVLFTVCNGGGSPPLYGSVAVTAVLYLLYMCIKPERYSRKRVAWYTIAAGICFICLNAYWIVPQIQLASSSYGSAVSDRGGIEGLIAWEGEISKHASFPNVLRLQGFPDWYGNTQHPYADYVLSHPFFRIFSWIPAVIILSGFAAFRFGVASRKEKSILMFALLLLAVGMFFTMGSHPPTGKIYVYFMRHIPGFAMFRSSFFKFAPLVYFPVIVLFGYYISEFFHRISVNRPAGKSISYGMSVAVLVLLGIYHYPAFTGNIFSLKWGFSTRVSVPPYVTVMGKKIGEHTPENARILIVPPLDTGFINTPIDTYTWGFYSLDLLPRILVNRSFLANDSNDGGVTRRLYSFLSGHDPQSFIRLSEALGVEYILWRGDVRQAEETQKKFPVSQWESAVGGLPGKEKVASSGSWSLFRLGNTGVRHDVSVPDEVAVVSRDVPDIGYLIAMPETAHRPVYVSVPSFRIAQSSGGIVSNTIQAECYFCKNHEYEKLIESIHLPAYRNYPFNFLVSRQRSIETDAIAKNRGNPQEIDAQLSAASARLSEFLSTGNIRSSVEYESHISRLLTVFHGLEQGRSKDMYATRISGYLGAHHRDVRDDRLKAYIQSVITSISGLQWKSDKSVYRFGMNTDSDGVFTMQTPYRDMYQSVGTIDGRDFMLADPVQLPRGYHRLELKVKDTAGTDDEIISPVFFREQFVPKNTTVPEISYTRIDPTRYDVRIRNASHPYILMLNQRFNRGWSILRDGLAKNVPHIEAQGYANAWIIPDTGSYTLTLLYVPQLHAWTGLLITSFSAFLCAVYLLWRRRYR